jgi:hypothetical protein
VCVCVCVCEWMRYIIARSHSHRHKRPSRAIHHRHGNFSCTHSHTNHTYQLAQHISILIQGTSALVDVGFAIFADRARRTRARIACTVCVCMYVCVCEGERQKGMKIIESCQHTRLPRTHIHSHTLTYHSRSRSKCLPPGTGSTCIHWRTRSWASRRR